MAYQSWKIGDRVHFTEVSLQGLRTLRYGNIVDNPFLKFDKWWSTVKFDDEPQLNSLVACNRLRNVSI